MERATPTPPGHRGRTALGYLAMLAAAVGVFLLIRSYGMDLTAPASEPGHAVASAPRASTDALMHVLLALIVVIVAARGLGAVFIRLHQPAVIGEVVAGIMLGPSLLGRVAPEWSAFLLPPAVAPFLGVISSV